MANILLMILIGFAIIIIANMIGGIIYLGVIWFSANQRWPWPLDSYFAWISRKIHDIRACAEAKQLGDEWREMNEGNWKRGKKFET